MARSDNVGPLDNFGPRERPWSASATAVVDHFAERHRNRGRPNQRHRCRVPSVPGARPFVCRAAALAPMMLLRAQRIRDHNCP
ncbi:hypothetical protein MTO96_020683 [Rhipicephalus appendiculatus]